MTIPQVAKTFRFLNSSGVTSGDFAAPSYPTQVAIDVYNKTWSQVFSEVSSAIASSNAHQGTITVEDVSTATAPVNIKISHTLVNGALSNSSFEVVTAGNHNHVELNEDFQVGGIAESSFAVGGADETTIIDNSTPELITADVYDNAFINTPIPRSDLQYSWINSAISGSQRLAQPLLDYVPRDGLVFSSGSYVSALVFPTASTIYAEQ